MTHKTAPPYAAFLLLVECGMLLMIPAGGLMFLRGSVSASVFLLFAYVGGMYLTEILPLQKMSTTFAQALSGVERCGRSWSFRSLKEAGHSRRTTALNWTM